MLKGLKFATAMNHYIIEVLYKELEVPYTRKYLRKYMRSLPLTDSLWAIKKTLDHYNISNSAIHLTDKSRLKDLSVPFLAQVAGDFCIVSSISEHNIRYTTAFKRVNTNIEQFVNEWSGIAVLCETYR